MNQEEIDRIKENISLFIQRQLEGKKEYMHRINIIDYPETICYKTEYPDTEDKRNFSTYKELDDWVTYLRKDIAQKRINKLEEQLRYTPIWHNYPEEKPQSSGSYLVAFHAFKHSKRVFTGSAKYDFCEADPLKKAFIGIEDNKEIEESAIIAWSDIPKYKPNEE